MMQPWHAVQPQEPADASNLAQHGAQSDLSDDQSMAASSSGGSFHPGTQESARLARITALQEAAEPEVEEVPAVEDEVSDSHILHQNL